MKKQKLIFLFVIAVLIFFLLFNLSHDAKELQSGTMEKIEPIITGKLVENTYPQFEIAQKELADRSESISQHPSYTISENKLELDTPDLHINIKYPQISFSYQLIDLDIEKEININKLLTSNYIQTLYDMVGNNIIISEDGTLSYDCSPYTYNLEMNESYTLGLANDDFFNLYVRSIDYIRSSHWSYGAQLINMKTGEKIKAEDFFDAEAFNDYIISDAFVTDKENFDIKAYLENYTSDDLLSYLYHAFINTKNQIEIVLIYGEGPETVIYADLDKVSGMIKKEYRDFLFVGQQEQDGGDSHEE